MTQTQKANGKPSALFFVPIDWNQKTQPSGFSAAMR